MAPSPPPALALLLLLLALPAEQAPKLDSDPGVQAVERYAQKMFNRFDGDDFYFRGSRLSLQTKVANEIKYNLKMEMAKTQCRKERGKELDWANLQKCQFAPLAEMKKKICDFEIWSELGNIGIRLMNMDCKPS